ncbi:chalcone isomerase family protein [Pseudomonas sp. SJZ079]|uniref:chalcone isomerase family protein n=1 Tax=Pseudomonas sp. SJZ079 TaxID=2572887 RepID=UPI00273FED22|nr:chalcone isomerase family protein [Pseudomonas sp. SJZ079]
MTTQALAYFELSVTEHDIKLSRQPGSSPRVDCSRPSPRYCSARLTRQQQRAPAQSECPRTNPTRPRPPDAETSKRSDLALDERPCRRAIHGAAGQPDTHDSHSKRLELYYFRTIEREDVIEAAWASLKRQQDESALAQLRNELDALHTSFRDIRPGDRYALNYNDRNGLTLGRHGQTALTSRNPELTMAHLDIWPVPEGLSETLRRRLLAD